MNTKLNELKNEIKSMATEIRRLKSTRKDVPYGYVSGLEELRNSARHHHIAYCELRGLTRDQIENPAEDNEPCEHTIDSIKGKYTELMEVA